MKKLIKPLIFSACRILAVGLLSSATTAQANPSKPFCVLVNPPFNLDATAIRITEDNPGNFTAHLETLFMWHGQICQESCARVRPINSIKVTRSQNGDETHYTGEDFSLIVGPPESPYQYITGTAVIGGANTQITGAIRGMQTQSEIDYCARIQN